MRDSAGQHRFDASVLEADIREPGGRRVCAYHPRKRLAEGEFGSGMATFAALSPVVTAAVHSVALEKALPCWPLYDASRSSNRSLRKTPVGRTYLAHLKQRTFGRLTLPAAGRRPPPRECRRYFPIRPMTLGSQRNANDR
jgi:hypothetical protein